MCEKWRVGTRSGVARGRVKGAQSWVVMSGTHESTCLDRIVQWRAAVLHTLDKNPRFSFMVFISRFWILWAGAHI